LKNQVPAFFKGLLRPGCPAPLPLILVTFSL